MPSGSLDREATPTVLTSHSQPSITINDQLFPIQHNLGLALIHLRSPTHSLALWVDAVCINQLDPEERDAQVAMMSFIYTRALKVAVWLGLNDHQSYSDRYRRMYNDWKGGNARLFAVSIADGTKLRCSADPTPGTAIRIAQSSYWTRLWIVQEMCLPRDLVFVYGPSIWRYEDVEKWEILKPSYAASLYAESTLSGIVAILRLAETRKARHSPKLRLDFLIEQFAKNQCSEVRDRVYSLLGLASDAYTFSNEDGGVPEDPADKILSLYPGLHRSDDLPRGSGHFKIRYSCRLYDLWADVVKFAFFRARPIKLEEWCSSESRKCDRLREVLEGERRISIVRTAGVVQAALNDEVEEEVAGLSLIEASAGTNSRPSHHIQPGC